jgi:large subunit ribosomal protein L10
LADVAERSVSVVVSEHCGLTVGDMTQLRVSAREQNVHLQVVRNRLAKRAFSGTKFESLAESLVGPSLLAFSFEAPGTAARLLKSYIKKNEALKVKMISLGSGNLGPEKLAFVASMPTRDEALAQIAMLLNAPVRAVAVCVKDVPGRLVRVLAAVAEQKEAQA